ncbi:MAG: hypothetical protein ACO2ON_04000 [Candidatus Nanopusillus sp.]
MSVTRQDILNDLELIKKGLQEIEFYLKNNVTDNNEIIERGVNGVIDYMRKILKDIVDTNAIGYSQILEDAKKKGLEREFRTAYRLLRQLNFIDYDQQNKLIVIGSRTKYLMKLFTDSKFEKKQEEKPKKTDSKKVEEIYNWILDQIIKNEWVSVDVIKETFKGYEKEIFEAIDKIISEKKGKLIDDKAIYRVNIEKPKSTDINKTKRIKELKDQISTLERKIQIGRAVKLSEGELKKYEEEKKKLKEELKKLEK